MKSVCYIILIFIFYQTGYSQSGNTYILSYSEFIQRVREHHPLAYQAYLQRAAGDAHLTKARGNFDPNLVGSAQQKYFNNQQYYSILNAGLKIPTWYGVSFQAGYDLNSGVQLNPERNIPDEGLWYAGVNVSLGSGLIIDQRRAEYKKAEIYRESTIQEQRILMNNLLLESSYAYWNWFKAFHQLKTYQQAVENATVRLNSVRQSALLGDQSFMDTLESSLQLQSRLYTLMEAELTYLNATKLVSIYLWETGFIPLELDTLTQPSSLQKTSIELVDLSFVLKIDSIRNNHPEILKTQYKIDQKKIDLQLSRNNLLPEMNLKYNAITSPSGGNAITNYSLHNYIWGADFSYPLFIRKERGQLKIDQLELENMEASLHFQSEKVQFEIESAFNQWMTTVDQINLWEKTTGDYKRLLEYEQELFAIGESSLFMVNSREINFINAQLKLIDTKMSNQLAAIKTKYALGILF